MTNEVESKEVNTVEVADDGLKGLEPIVQAMYTTSQEANDLMEHILKAMDGLDHTICENGLTNALVFIITQAHPENQWTRVSKYYHDFLVRGLKAYRTKRESSLIVPEKYK